MNPITDILDSEESSRAKLFSQYQTMLQSMTANRLPDPIKESEKSENDQEEDLAHRKDHPGDQWIHGGSGEEEASDHPYLQTGQVGHWMSEPTSPVQSEDVLSEEDKDLVQRLQARDREVRQHEQAHAAALGQYAGAISYTFQVGPDGRSYAIGGSTEVLSGADSSPEAAQARAHAIRTAATAASEPSPADRTAAADAIRMEHDAQLRGKEKS